MKSLKVETVIMAIFSVFCMLVAPAYWLIAEDPTGTAALVMAAGLGLLITFYVGFHGTRLEARPEDNRDAEIADGAGELGFFPPYSWWPLWCAASGALVFYSLAFKAWWLFTIGVGLGLIATVGLVFEYYRGEHAH